MVVYVKQWFSLFEEHHAIPFLINPFQTVFWWKAQHSLPHFKTKIRISTALVRVLKIECHKYISMKISYRNRIRCERNSTHWELSKRWLTNDSLYVWDAIPCMAAMRGRILLQKFKPTWIYTCVNQYLYSDSSHRNQTTFKRNNDEVLYWRYKTANR